MCCGEQLELEMIDKLDTHITQGRGDAGFKEDLSRMWVTAQGTQLGSSVARWPCTVQADWLRTALSGIDNRSVSVMLCRVAPEPICSYQQHSSEPLRHFDHVDHFDISVGTSVCLVIPLMLLHTYQVCMLCSSFELG